MGFKNTILFSPLIAVLLASYNSDVLQDEKPTPHLKKIENKVANDLPIQLPVETFSKKTYLTNEGQPIHNLPVVTPNDADKSGHCIFKIEVSSKGEVVSITSLDCSDEIFAPEMTKALKKWRFRPKKNEAGENASFVYGPQKFVFRILDFDGNLIPE